MNLSKRLALLGGQSAFSIAKPGGLGSSYGFPFRQISELTKANGKPAHLVDTLALVRSLEAQGVPSKQAEAITSAITTVYNGCLKETQSQLVADEVAKLRMELYKYRAEFHKMIAEESREHNICTNKVEQDLGIATRDLRKECVELTVDYESAKLQALKYAMGTLASVVAIGSSWYRLMK